MIFRFVRFENGTDKDITLGNNRKTKDMGLPKEKPGTCLTRVGVSLCVSHLLLGIYERAPGHLTRHVADCMLCRKLVVSLFAQRVVDLAKYMSPDNFADQVRYLHAGVPPLSKDLVPKVN